MLFRVGEVVSVLALVIVMLIAKHVPMIDQLPWSHLTGIVCFAFAIFLSLRIYNAELARIRAEE